MALSPAQSLFLKTSMRKKEDCVSKIRFLSGTAVVGSGVMLRVCTCNTLRQASHSGKDVAPETCPGASILGLFDYQSVNHDRSEQRMCRDLPVGCVDGECRSEGQWGVGVCVSHDTAER